VAGIMMLAAATFFDYAHRHAPLFPDALAIVGFLATALLGVGLIVWAWLQGLRAKSNRAYIVGLYGLVLVLLLLLLSRDEATYLGVVASLIGSALVALVVVEWRP
jgi:low temperature requirement protein LtrA